MLRLRLFTAACAAALLCALMAPAAGAAASGTATTAATATTATTAKDRYGETTPLSLPTGTAAKADVGTGGGTMARTFIGLAVVVAVIYGLTWVLRQMKSRSDAEAEGFGLSSEASVPLGPGRSVHLIRAGRELLLVGSAEHGVVPIRTYSEDEALALGLIEASHLPDVVEAPRVAAPRTAVAQLVAGLRERTVR